MRVAFLSGTTVTRATVGLFLGLMLVSAFNYGGVVALHLPVSCCILLWTSQADTLWHFQVIIRILKRVTLTPNPYSHADSFSVLCAEVLRYQSLSFLPPPQYNGVKLNQMDFFKALSSNKQNPIHLNQGGSRGFRIGSLEPKVTGWVAQVSGNIM